MIPPVTENNSPSPTLPSKPVRSKRIFKGSRYTDNRSIRKKKYSKNTIPRDLSVQYFDEIMATVSSKSINELNETKDLIKGAELGKNIKRIYLNRISARMCRLKKQKKAEQNENLINELTNENQKLKDENATLKKKIDDQAGTIIDLELEILHFRPISKYQNHFQNHTLNPYSHNISGTYNQTGMHLLAPPTNPFDLNQSHPWFYGNQEDQIPQSMPNPFLQQWALYERSLRSD